MVTFQLYLQSGKQRKVGWWKRKCENVRYHDAMASSFVAKVWDSLHTFHIATVKCHSSMWNWLFGLPERVLCEPSPWCQRKRWACSWLCSSPVLHFSVSVSSDFPLGGLLLCLRVITVNPALITSDNLGQEGCIFRADLIKLLADLGMLLFWSADRNHIRPDTRLQIKGR
jgi:hypothetical protein